jgi:hypothetical protein
MTTKKQVSEIPQTNTKLNKTYLKSRLPHRIRNRAIKSKKSKQMTGPSNPVARMSNTNRPRS